MGHRSAFITVFLCGERKEHCSCRQNLCIRSGSIAQAFFAKEEGQICTGGGLVISGGTRVLARTKTEKEGEADHICYCLAFPGGVLVKGEFEGV